MVATHPNSETVFTVLGDAARRRSTGSLAIQLGLSSAIAAAILVSAPRWWSLAFLAGWSTAYAAWGLIVRAAEAHESRRGALKALLMAIAAVGTSLAIAGIIGVALAFYTGNAKGVKDACGKGSTNERCQAFANPTKVTGPIR